MLARPSVGSDARLTYPPSQSRAISRLTNGASRSARSDKRDRRTGPDACSAEMRLIAGRERCTPDRSARLRAASRPPPMRPMRTIAFSTRCRSSSRATAADGTSVLPARPAEDPASRLVPVARVRSLRPSERARAEPALARACGLSPPASAVRRDDRATAEVALPEALVRDGRVLEREQLHL